MKESGPSFFESNSVNMLPWFNPSAPNVNNELMPKRVADKEVIVFSSQRSGSTLFSQLLMKYLSCGVPREHFNHAFRGDHGNNVSFSDIWELGRKDNMISHKIMASDFARLASVLGISGNFANQLEGLVEFFTANPSHFFYRVKRENFFYQYQSSITAQLTGVYFGRSASENSLKFDEKDCGKFVKTWLSLKSSEIVLDWLWQNLGNNKRLVKYETNLKNQNERNELLDVVASDLQRPLNKNTPVSLTPPTTDNEKEKNKQQFVTFLKNIVGAQAFELYFASSSDI